MNFEVTILGCSSATPVIGRNPSAQLLQINGHIFLIDCGEGTQHQMIKLGISLQKIDAVFISHLHGDHYLGLVGLISSMHLNGRKRSLQLYAPEILKSIIETQLIASDTHLSYPIEYHFTQANSSEIIYKNTEIQVETLILNHRIPCTGFKFTQLFSKRKLIKEKIGNIPTCYLQQLKNAENVQMPDGTWIYFEEVSTPGKPSKSYAYCSDTKPDNRYLPQIKNVDVLYHEATFLHELLERAELTHHTTALQAAQIAENSEVKKLVLGHFSSRYKDSTPLLIEAKSLFQNSILAYDGLKFNI